MYYLTSEEGEEPKCIGYHIFTSKKYSDPIGYIFPYTNTQNFKKSMIAYFLAIDKDETLSCMEPVALKSKV